MHRQVSQSPRPRAPLAGLLAVLAALALAACGSSSSSKTTTTTNNTGSAAAAATTSTTSAASTAAGNASGGPAIKVMQIVDYTPPSGPPDFAQLDGAQAAIDAANAAGGVNGRHIVLLHCDAKSSPSSAAACANEAIHAHVVALVGSQVNEDMVTTPLLMKAGIPIIGNNPSTTPGENDPDSACFVAGTVPTFVGMITGLATQDHVKKIGMLEPAIPGIGLINAAAKAAAKAHGAQITKIVPIGFNVTNFGPAVQSVLSGGAQAIVPFAGGNPAALAQLIAQVKQVNPDVKIVFPSFELTPPFEATLGPAEQSSLVVGYTQFSSATDTPGVAQFRQQISKIKSSEASSDPALWAWLGADAFAKIARTIHGPITQASVTKALKQTKHLDLGGVVPPYTYAYNTLGLGCLTNGSPAFGRISGKAVKPNSGNNLINVMTPDIVTTVKQMGG